MSRFSFFNQEQRAAYCGPCSLSYCLSVLGIEADQNEVAKKAGTSWRYGTSEEQLMLAARQLGATAKKLRFKEKGDAPTFAARLREHLAQGLPAIVCIMDGDHWVAVVGLDERDRIIVADPNAESVFGFWGERALLSNAWLAEVEGGPEYYAILLRRTDDLPPLWMMTPAFRKLCSRGSGDSAEGMVEMLFEIVQRSGVIGAEGGGRRLAEVLASHEETIVENAWYWTGYEGDVGKADVRRQYRDFTVIAEATRLVLPEGVDHAALVAQVTTVLCAFIWNDGELS